MIEKVVIVFLGCYFLWLVIEVLWGYLRQRKKERMYEATSEVRPDEITVLIPFRNEAQRIHQLLESIQNLNDFPAKIIFIDDHSTDDSVQLISTAMATCAVQSTVLSAEGSGKKRALRTGAKDVKTRYTLTWDADISVAPDYFEKISHLGHADMYVFPAILEPANTAQYMYEFDVVLGNAFNAGISGWLRPIFASGANLLYNTEAFEKFDSINKHEHVTSGDDTFLLGDFVRNKADVRLHTSPDLAIRTETPQSFREYIDQRLRWVGKTSALKDDLNTRLAIQQFIFTIVFVGSLVLTCVTGNALVVALLIGGKTCVDFLVFTPYFIRLKRVKTLLFLPIAELWFPVFSIIIVVLMPFYRPKWKGRAVRTKK